MAQRKGTSRTTFNHVLERAGTFGGQFLSESPHSTTGQRLRLVIIKPRNGIVASSGFVSVYWERQNSSY